MISLIIPCSRYLGVQPSYDDCLKAAMTSPMNPFYSVTWHNLQFPGYEGHCYGMKDRHWGPVKEDGVTSGNLEGRNIWCVISYY